MSFNVVEIREDDDGDLGNVMGIYIEGHHEDDVALPIAWTELFELGAYGAVGRPRRTYLRQVPVMVEGEFRYHRFVYSKTPGPGAKPVTVVETASWPRWGTCYSCPWDAVTKIPASRFTDVPEGVTEIPYCKEHAAAFDERLKLARREAMAELDGRKAS